MIADISISKYHQALREYGLMLTMYTQIIGLSNHVIGPSMHKTYIALVRETEDAILYENTAIAKHYININSFTS